MFGLDIGNDTSAVAAVAGTGADVLPNAIGNRTPPTAVSYGSQQRYLAEDAVSQRSTNWRNTVVGLPSLLAHCPLPTDGELVLSGTQSGGDGVRVSYRNQEMTVATEAVLGAYVGGMVRLAKSECGVRDPSFVVAKPSHFSPGQGQSLRHAAIIGGTGPRVQLCDEALATALFYAHDRLSSRPPRGTQASAVLFVDSGHSHTTAFIAAFDHGERALRVVDSEVVMMGGRDFDALLASKFEADFAAEKGEALSSERARLRLLKEAEKAKTVLSANSSWSAMLEELQAGADFHARATREELSQLCTQAGFLHQLSAAVVTLLLRVLTTTSPGGGEGERQAAAVAMDGDALPPLETVELLGGCARIPAVAAAVMEAVHSIEGMGAVAEGRSLNGAESVARGCALFGISALGQGQTWMALAQPPPPASAEQEGQEEEEPERSGEAATAAAGMEEPPPVISPPPVAAEPSAAMPTDHDISPPPPLEQRGVHVAAAPPNTAAAAGLSASGVEELRAWEQECVRLDAEVGRAYEAHNALETLVYGLRDTVRSYGTPQEAHEALPALDQAEQWLYGPEGAVEDVFATFTSSSAAVAASVGPGGVDGGGVEGGSAGAQLLARYEAERERLQHCCAAALERERQWQARRESLQALLYVLDVLRPVAIDPGAAKRMRLSSKQAAGLSKAVSEAEAWLAAPAQGLTTELALASAGGSSSGTGGGERAWAQATASRPPTAEVAAAMAGAAGGAARVVEEMNATRAALEERWPLLLTGERGRAIAEATELMEADKELPPGTRLRVEGYGDGVYESFASNWFGANEHTLRFEDKSGGGGYRLIPLKLRDMSWEVIAPAPSSDK